MSVDLNALAAPFPPERIEWRIGSTNRDKTGGIALAYLTARDVMDRLDSVCGAANWQDRYEFHGARTVCYLSIRIGNEWVTKADGAGDSDVEAEKGAISDALKRAAVKWGIGRYLYELDTPWVDIEQAGRSYKIKPGQEAKLAKALGRVSQQQPAPRSEPANTQQKGPVTPAGRTRQPGQRLTDSHEINTITEALLENLVRKGEPKTLKEWMGTQREQIRALPDPAFDEVMKAYDERLADLQAGEVFA